jgi:hypothetical protein
MGTGAAACPDLLDDVRYLPTDHAARQQAHDLELDGKSWGPDLGHRKWAGHFDSAFTQKTYVHANEEDLTQGAEKLATIYKIA